MRLPISTIIASAAVAFASPVLAQTRNAPAPFGIEKGRPLLEIQKIGERDKQNPEWVVIKSPPKPHPDFDTYMVLASKTHGVCKVVALSKTVDTSVYGEALRNSFDRINEALTDRYDKGDRQDFLRVGSIWDEPRDWMMALLKNERTLSTIWTSPRDGIGINAIMLKAAALSTEKGFVALHYEFDTFEACRAEIDDARNDVF